MYNEKGLLVFIDTNDPDGHEADLRIALGKALGQTPYSIFEDIPKAPENVFSVTVGSILFSDSIILDGNPHTDLIAPHSLIQYGICYALQKRCIFVSIKNNSGKVASETRDSMVEGCIQFDYYLDFETQFSSKFKEWSENSIPTRRVKPNMLPVHSYVVFGIDRWRTPDLYSVVENFSHGTGWTPRIISDLGFLSKLERLAIQISQRSFCVFCLNEYDSEKVFLGIGLAIGMGRPFLIIKHKTINLPIVLNGYHGVIEYENYSELSDKLRKYAGKFLSAEVFEWEGATYNDLLVGLEKRIDSLDPTALAEFETSLIAITSVLGEITAKPFALLGEIYRERNRKVSPDSVELLKKAKEAYEKALNIQKDYQLYQDAVTAIDRHIQLIELVKEKKYHSIPVLINLIGDLKGNHYSQVKEYLISIVKKLVEDKDFVHAVSLLAAMQIHDESEEIKKLIYQILESAPLETIKALQDAQKSVVKLEDQKKHLIKQIIDKSVLIDESLEKLKSYEEQLEPSQTNQESTQSELSKMQRTIEEIQKERDGLKTKLINISAQFSVVHKDVSKLKSEIEKAKALGGRGVIVDFGPGWAIYENLGGKPYIVRNGERFSARKWFVIKNGDMVYDEAGNLVEDYLPSGTISIKPGDDLYATFLNRNLKT